MWLNCKSRAGRKNSKFLHSATLEPDHESEVEQEHGTSEEAHQRYLSDINYNDTAQLKYVVFDAPDPKLVKAAQFEHRYASVLQSIPVLSAFMTPAPRLRCTNRNRIILGTKIFAKYQAVVVAAFVGCIALCCVVLFALCCCCCFVCCSCVVVDDAAAADAVVTYFEFFNICMPMLHMLYQEEVRE